MENKFSITSYFPSGKYSLPKVAIYAKPQNVGSNLNANRLKIGTK